MSQVARWLFSETSGTSFADSIGSRTGTFAGSPVFNNPGFQCDAVDVIGTVPWHASLDMGSGSFSVSLFARPGTNLPTTSVTLIRSQGIGNTANYKGWRLNAKKDVGTERWNFGNDCVLAGSTANAINPQYATWFKIGPEYNVILSVDRTADIARIYVDGIQYSQWSTAGIGSLSPTNSTPFQIGACTFSNGVLSTWSRGFSGGLRDISYYNHALTATEAAVVSGLAARLKKRHRADRRET